MKQTNTEESFWVSTDLEIMGVFTYGDSKRGKICDSAHRRALILAL